MLEFFIVALLSTIIAGLLCHVISSAPKKDRRFVFRFFLCSLISYLAISQNIIIDKIEKMNVILEELNHINQDISDISLDKDQENVIE